MDLLANLKGRYGDDGDAEGDWQREWVAPHLLVVDEIGELVVGDHGRAAFSALIDTRYRRGKPTILLGNLTRDQFGECVGASIADRTNEGLGGIVLFEGWPSFRTEASQMEPDHSVV